MYTYTFKALIALCIINNSIAIDGVELEIVVNVCWWAKGYAPYIEVEDGDSVLCMDRCQGDEEYCGLENTASEVESEENDVKG